MGSVETELTSGAITGGVLAALVEALGPDRVVVDPAVTVAYSRDMMPLAPSGRPLAVVLPISTAEVVAIVRICAADAAAGPT